MSALSAISLSGMNAAQTVLCSSGARYRQSVNRGISARTGASPHASYAFFDAFETRASNCAVAISDDTDRSSDERESPESL